LLLRGRLRPSEPGKEQAPGEKKARQARDEREVVPKFEAHDTKE
jgi:hypothetical protein